MAQIANLACHLFLITNNEVTKQKLNKLCKIRKNLKIGPNRIYAQILDQILAWIQGSIKIRRKQLKSCKESGSTS